jgi:hypothetical protein
VRGSTPTHRTDVLVLGTTLGSLVAAAYLSRAQLRVVVLEEDVLAQRPPLLREPFALTGLERGGPIQAVLEELGVPMIERRELAFEHLALQVALKGARIEVGAGRPALAHELEVYGLAAAPVALDWLEALDAGGEVLRAELRSGGAPSQSTLRALSSRLRLGRRSESAEAMPHLPPTPTELEPFYRAIREALSGGCADVAPAPSALLLRSMRDGAHRMPHAGRPFLDLFRRRIVELHGEIRPASGLELIRERGAIGFELPRGRVMARALVIGAPLASLGRVLDRSAPRWLRKGEPAEPIPARLLRAERSALPVGMARRGIDATGQQLRWWTRSAEPSDPRVEWIVLAGDGLSELSDEAPLGELVPFAADKIEPVDAGPMPTWDLDPPAIRVRARAAAVLQRRPPVCVVGPERAPELGIEGEILLARATALDLIHRLTGS